jgi:hypothetical protein
MDLGVELAKQMDRVQILSATVRVGDPLSLLAANSPDTASMQQRRLSSRRCDTCRARRDACWRSKKFLTSCRP